MLRVFILLLLCASSLSAQAPDLWPPLTPQEIALKDDPARPGSHAVILYREMVTNDDKSWETHLFRIKVLTEEGKKAANIEIPYAKETFSVKDLEARLVRPDGTIVPFTGQVFDKLIARSRRGTRAAKSFTLPDVQVGSIIEYRFKLAWNPLMLYATRWTPEHNFSTLRARFLLKRYKTNWFERFAGFQNFSLQWASFNLPPGKAPRTLEDGSVLLEMENVPAFVEESNMPPEDEARMRVQFFYSPKEPISPEEFWRREGRAWHNAIEKFIGKGNAFQQAAAETIRGIDAPEARLRALYARAQKIRNLSFEREKTDKEWKRIKDITKAEQMLTYGHGTRSEVNRFFVALARAAGFDAGVVRLAERDNKFFHMELLSDDQLDGEVAIIRLDSRQLYLDPGTPFCPFGMLSWEKTSTRGIVLNADGGTFVTTPSPAVNEAVIERTAALALAEDGSARGSVHLTYSGRHAIANRIRAQELDDLGRRKALEDALKRLLPQGANVELKNVPGWEGSDDPLRAEFAVEIPQLASATGRRLLLPLSIFEAGRNERLMSSTRVHPIYRSFPGAEVDEITITLPSRFQLESLPEGMKRAEKSDSCEISWLRQGNTLQLKRRYASDGIHLPVHDFSALRDFVGALRAADQAQAVLQPAAQ